MGSVRRGPNDVGDPAMAGFPRLFVETGGKKKDKEGSPPHSPHRVWLTCGEGGGF